MADNFRTTRLSLSKKRKSLVIGSDEGPSDKTPRGSTVILGQSDDNETDESDQNASSCKIATNSKPWIFEQDIASRGEFEDFLAEEGCWSILSGPLYQKKGVTTVYRCNKVKRRGPQCSAGLKTLHDFAPDDPTIKVYRRHAEHDCDKSTNVNSNVPSEIQQFIISQSEIGQTAGGIVLKLRETFPESDVTSSQISNVLNYHRKKLYGKSQVTLQDLQIFFEQNNTLPVNIDEPFVANFARSAPNATEKFFRLFYSTKRLLQYAQEAKTFHMDGTYKITIQGFPVLIVGSSDIENRFHLSGLGLCSSEGAADYQFMLDSLMNGVITVTNEEIHPNAIVGDSAASITKAIRDVFDDDDNVIRIHCFSHVMMNVEKQKFQKPEHKTEFKDDIRRLQMSFDESTFDSGCKLLEKNGSKRKVMS